MYLISCCLKINLKKNLKDYINSSNFKCIIMFICHKMARVYTKKVQLPFIILALVGIDLKSRHINRNRLKYNVVFARKTRVTVQIIERFKNIRPVHILCCKNVYIIYLYVMCVCVRVCALRVMICCNMYILYIIVAYRH